MVAAAVMEATAMEGVAFLGEVGEVKAAAAVAAMVTEMAGAAVAAVAAVVGWARAVATEGVAEREEGV